MNLIYQRAGRDWVALNAQHDVVGILKSFEDSWKGTTEKSLRNDPEHPSDMKLVKGGS